jgi:biopolymer transport protein ExbD
MARKRTQREFNADELNMTAMIDIVFQLLIFFILTVKPIDTFTHLDVFRPSGETTAPKDKPPPVLRIQVYADGYSVNEVPIAWADLQVKMRRFAEIDLNQTVLIMTSSGAPHERLIRLLDLCAQNKMKNLSVVSTR